MVSNRAYKRCDVKKVDVEVLRDRACDRGGAATAVGLDVAKQEIVACVRWADGSFEEIDHVTSNFQTMKPALLWLEHVMGFEQMWKTLDIPTPRVVEKPYCRNDQWNLSYS